MVKKKRISAFRLWTQQPKFWLRNVSFPLAFGAAYYLLFAWFVVAVRRLPPGVNYAFARTLWPALLGLAIVVGVAAWRQRPRNTARVESMRNWQRHDWLLALLPLAPVLQYVMANKGLLRAGEIAGLMLAFLAPVLLLVVWLPAALSRWADPSVLRIVGLVLAFMIMDMASLSYAFLWYERGQIGIQLAILLALFALTAGLYLTGREGLLAVLAAVYFISSGFVQPISLETGSVAVADMYQHPLFAHIAGRQPAAKPNVYLLIYDAYVPNEVMLQYGIDNSPQENYLLDLGFTLYPHTYSIGAHSVATMTPVLNVSNQLLWQYALGHIWRRGGANGLP